MGNKFSNAVGGIPEPHVRIYKNLLQIQSPATRIQMLETLLAGQEYVITAKVCGLYGPILSYMAAARRGDTTALLPGEQARPHQQQIQHMAQPGQYPSQPGRLPSQQPARGPAQGVRVTAGINGSIIARKGNPDDHTKAISFFTRCLNVLGLEEEVALNEDVLKKAYKKASMRAHPDKGGSEEAFDAVTRAYAYLGDILRRVRGGRDNLVDVANETPDTVNNTRAQAAEAWKMGDPVKLNPKNLDMNAFNRLFEEMRIPDPDGDGYGDWLKSEDAAGGAGGGSRFGGKFNRDVFNSTFEDEMRSRAREGGAQLSICQPEALNLAPTFGLEIGRDRPDSFTAANLNGFQYTDLKQAYTTDSTFSHQVSGVQVGNRTFNGMKSERGSAPAPLSAQELADIQESERQMQARQQQRVIRAQEEDRRVSDQFARIKQRVIMDATPVQKSIQNAPAPRQQQLQNGSAGAAGQRYAITNH